MATIKTINKTSSSNLRRHWILFCTCFMFVLVNVSFYSLKPLLSVNLIAKKAILYFNERNVLKNAASMELCQVNETQRLDHPVSHLIHYDWIDLRRSGEFPNMRFKPIEPNKLNRTQVLIISAFVPAPHVFFRRTRLVSLKNKRAFAAYAGWNFRYFVTNPLTDRPPMWNKLTGIIKAIDEQVYDWILWVDADTLIANFDMNIVDITGAAYNDKSKVIFICKDENGLNSGVLLVRSNDVAKQILEIAFNQTQFITHLWAEQMGIREVLEKDGKFNNSYVYVKNELLNYYRTTRHSVFTENIQHYPGGYKSPPPFLYYGHKIRQKYHY